MSIAEFLVSKGYGRSIHEVEEKFYNYNASDHKLGYVFLVNSKKVIDIYYSLNNGDELIFIHNGKHKYTIGS